MFHRAPRPTPTELARLPRRIAQRVARLLERHGLLVRDLAALETERRDRQIKNLQRQARYFNLTLLPADAASVTG